MTPEAQVAVLNSQVQQLITEMQALTAEVAGIKGHMKMGKGIFFGALFVIGCAAIGLKEMLLKFF